MSKQVYGAVNNENVWRFLYEEHWSKEARRWRDYLTGSESGLLASALLTVQAE